MTVSFLKKGKAAQAAMKKQDEIDKEKMEQNLYKSRFWMKEDTETHITFLTGNLDEDGILDTPMYYEHHLHLNGHWRNWFVCTAHDEPCPICEGGDNAALVGAFVIIDHTEWKDKNDKIHRDELRLLVAKRETIKMLQKIATKRKGLVGCTFEVSRTGENAANVGSMFDFENKSTVAALKKKYKFEELKEFDEIIVYKSAKELNEMGFGSYTMGSGTAEPDEDDDGTGEDSGDDGDASPKYADQL